MAKKRPLLVLIDGHALVHRAFHALPSLSLRKTGEPTGAVYGFTSMLLKVLREYKPAYCAVAFDSPAPTFRHEQFKEYKAHRPKAPEELIRQFRRVRELVATFDIPAFEVDGYEADDILGALCRQAFLEGVDTLIVTGDADTMQLVTPHIRVLTPRPGRPFGDTVIYDEDKVRERYGVEPSQIVDLKGLKGDPSDNIPGVPGIGEKTALRLIQRFGSVEGIYERIEEVEPLKVQGALRTNEREARLSKSLATIVSEVPITLELHACHMGTYERERVIELFRELEFSSLLNKLPELDGEESAVVGMLEEIGAQGPQAGEVNYQIVATSEALDELVSRLASSPSFVVDLETTGRDPRRAALVGLSFSVAPGEAWYVPVGHKGWDLSQLPLEKALEALKPLFESSDIAKMAHNGKYDMTVLANYGVRLQNLAFDTMIAAHLLGEKALGLKPLAFNKLRVEMTPISDLIGSGTKQASMAEVNIAAVAQYACADADITGQLGRLLGAELGELGLWQPFTEVEMPLVPVLLRMEQHGVALDTDLLRQMSRDLGAEIAELEVRIYNSVGHRFNVNSTQQLSAVLFEELGLPRKKRTKGGYSTEAAVLEELRGLHPVIEIILEYRQLTKLKSTYIDALPSLIDPRTGRVHTSFNQTGTATGRLSSSEPNLQNIPIRTEQGKRIRQAFVAQEDSLLLGGDYSQIDLRVLAHFSQDQRLLAAFAEDEDIHMATASEVFGVPKEGVTPEMRRTAKTVNFGVIYGMSEYGLEQATDLSRGEAAQFIKAYFERYPGVKAYLDATKARARDNGYVQTILGRRRYIPEVNSSNAQVRMAAERMAINMPVQGTSADIIKLAMVDLQRRMDERKLQSKMILQVHDELLFEVPPGELEEMKQLVGEVMPRALEVSVPLKVDLKVGKNWDAMNPE